MIPKWSRNLAAVVLIASFAVLTTALGLRRAGSQDTPAATVNGTILTHAEAFGMATTTARVREHNPQFVSDPSSWVDKEIMYQEALKRGLGCSPDEAAQQLRATYEQMVRDGHPEAILIVATDSGEAPDGYYMTPASVRTPGADTVIETYLSDARVISAQQKACSIVALAATVNTPNTNGIATVVATGRASQAISIDSPRVP